MVEEKQRPNSVMGKAMCACLSPETRKCDPCESNAYLVRVKLRVGSGEQLVPRENRICSGQEHHSLVVGQGAGQGIWRETSIRCSDAWQL